MSEEKSPKEQSSEAVAPPLPSKLERADQLSLAISVERRKRVEAELRAAQAELRAVQLEARIVEEQLVRRYALGPTDLVDYETGVITRANGVGEKSTLAKLAEKSFAEAASKVTS